MDKMQVEDLTQSDEEVEVIDSQTVTIPTLSSVGHSRINKFMIALKEVFYKDRTPIVPLYQIVRYVNLRWPGETFSVEEVLAILNSMTVTVANFNVSLY